MEQEAEEDTEESPLRVVNVGANPAGHHQVPFHRCRGCGEVGKRTGRTRLEGGSSRWDAARRMPPACSTSRGDGGKPDPCARVGFCQQTGTIGWPRPSAVDKRHKVDTGRRAHARGASKPVNHGVVRKNPGSGLMATPQLITRGGPRPLAEHARTTPPKQRRSGPNEPRVPEPFECFRLVSEQDSRPQVRGTGVRLTPVPAGGAQPGTCGPTTRGTSGGRQDAATHRRPRRPRSPEQHPVPQAARGE